MFTITNQDRQTKARSGIFKTSQGSFPTPSFFPVATKGAVKGLSPRELNEIGVDGLLVNAYHLYLRPGLEVIKRNGGLHKFMNFDKTIITDSGGYQIFSLEQLRKVTDEGVEFQSYLDGKRIFLTPEEVIRIQIGLGSDVIVPLDECSRYPTSRRQAEIAVRRTIEWAKRSKDIFQKEARRDILFMGIIQGSTYADLREECWDEISSLIIDGICIGGLSVGEPQDLRYNILSFLESKVNKSYLRYFMGYGKPPDILNAVSFGIDLFDCVLPTRFARTGTAFTKEGEIVVRDAPYLNDLEPLDKDCSCYTCRNFSRSYLRHLINAKEILGPQLLCYHNLFWYKQFMDKIRSAINEGKFTEFKHDFFTKYKD